MNIIRKISPLLIILAGVICYSGSFSGVFIFDDYIWIVNNDAIRSLWSSLAGSSRPLAGLTFHLNYLAGGLKTADYHLFNLLVHLSAGLLLFGILGNTFKLPKLAELEGGNSRLIALLITLLWIVHPLNTESVTYIVQRSESMMGMFYLLTLYCFIRGLTSSANTDRWFTGAVIACALGMACKPVMVTAPLIVLLYDRTFVTGSFMESLAKRRSVYAGLAATWIILAALLSVPTESSSSAGFSAITESPLRYFVTEAGVVLHYIKLVFLPFDLCLDYDWPPAGYSPATLLQVGLTALFLGFFLKLFLKQGIAGFAGLSFFVLLFPSSGIVPLSDCAAEHRMYLPLIPIIILIAIALMTVQRRFAGDASPAFGRWVVFPALAVIIGLSCLTIKRNTMYQSEELMWKSVISLRPDNVRGHLGLGVFFLRDGQNRQAEACFTRILGDSRFAGKKSSSKYATEFSMAYNNLGVIRFQEGMHSEAEECFKKALKAGFSIDAQRNLAVVRSMMKDRPQNQKRIL